jgi:hypothetical protein
MQQQCYHLQFIASSTAFDAVALSTVVQRLASVNMLLFLLLLLLLRLQCLSCYLTTAAAVECFELAAAAAAAAVAQLLLAQLLLASADIALKLANMFLIPCCSCGPSKNTTFY